MDVTLSCECPTGTYRVTVRGGERVQTTALDAGNRTAEDFVQLSFEDLFELIEDNADAHRLDVEYDPELGYPSKIALDGNDRTVDDEAGYTVSDDKPSAD